MKGTKRINKLAKQPVTSSVKKWANKSTFTATYPLEGGGKLTMVRGRMADVNHYMKGTIQDCGALVAAGIATDHVTPYVTVIHADQAWKNRQIPEAILKRAFGDASNVDGQAIEFTYVHLSTKLSSCDAGVLDNTGINPDRAKHFLIGLNRLVYRSGLVRTNGLKTNTTLLLTPGSNQHRAIYVWNRASFKQIGVTDKPVRHATFGRDALLMAEIGSNTVNMLPARAITQFLNQSASSLDWTPYQGKFGGIDDLAVGDMGMNRILVSSKDRGFSVINVATLHGVPQFTADVNLKFDGGLKNFERVVRVSGKGIVAINRGNVGFYGAKKNPAVGEILGQFNPSKIRPSL